MADTKNPGENGNSSAAPQLALLTRLKNLNLVDTKNTGGNSNGNSSAAALLTELKNLLDTKNTGGNSNDNSSAAPQSALLTELKNLLDTKNTGENSNGNSSATPQTDPVALLTELKNLLDTKNTGGNSNGNSSAAPQTALLTRLKNLNLLDWESKDTEDSLIISVDMPGLSKEHVKVCLEDDTLIIKGENQDVARSYEGTIRLPSDSFQMHLIKPVVKNGILKLFIPKVKKPAKALLHLDVE